MQAELMTRPWYSDGLRFSCTRCGDCCAGPQEGYVWTNAEELAQIAAYLGLSSDELVRRYVRTIGVRRSLRLNRNKDCIFFDRATRGCTIYPVRPRQCRSWPFWDSNVRTERAWQRTCAVCPGAGKGKLVPLEEIERRVASIRV